MVKYVLLGLGSLVVAGVLVLALYPAGDSGRGAPVPSPGSIPLGIIGDSGSHSYQDQIAFSSESPERGGALRPKTFSWAEVLARLRGKELDLGPWVEWGRPWPVAWARELIGMEGGRSPKKQDYLYNFAFSGATCNNLMGVGLKQRFHQVPRLVDMMNHDPERWKNGVVVIYLGINDWVALGDLPATTPNAPAVNVVIDHCAGEIHRSIVYIHASHPNTRIMVVGIVEDTGDPEYVSGLPSASARANMQLAIGRFNSAVRHVVESAPGGAYFDIEAWSAQHWGANPLNELNPVTTLEIGGFKVTNTRGDDPHNALLADDHSGLVSSTLLAQSMVARLREAFGLPLTPISDDEVAAFVLPLVRPSQ